MTRPPEYFQAFRRSVTSQHGEDGILEHLFELIGVESRWCVELGALNGTHDSNVYHLVKDKGWSAVLLEADPTYYRQAVAAYADAPQAHLINAFVSFEGPSSLDVLLASTYIPEQFDFLSLDIDGNDYHLWGSLQMYHPRVVCIEYNPTIPDDVMFVQSRDMQIFQGSSARALVALGEQKGYELVAATQTNLFFVERPLFEKLNFSSNELAEIRKDRSLETKFFQLYDGNLVFTGNLKMPWHKRFIDPERLQMLPKRKRKYPARISESDFIRRCKQFARTMPFYPFVQKVRKTLTN